eukprot:1193051-Prorocentrum_minimum.AAC.2
MVVSVTDDRRVADNIRATRCVVSYAVGDINTTTDVGKTFVELLVHRGFSRVIIIASALSVQRPAIRGSTSAELVMCAE